MKRIQELKKGLELKEKIEKLLEEYGATIYYEDDEGCSMSGISIYKKETFDLEIEIKNNGELG